jgi:hypothetical protein
MSAVLEPVAGPGRLVVIGRADARPADPRPDPLLAAHLPAARSVLEVGSASASLEQTARRADVVTWCSVRPQDLSGVEAHFDTIVLTEAIEDTPDPVWLIRALSDLAGRGTTLVMACRNSASRSALDALVEGDPRPGGFGLAPASLTGLLLDEGWMPQICGIEPSPGDDLDVGRAAQALAPAVGVPAATVRRLLSTGRFVVHARRMDPAPEAAGACARFTVVVPTTRDGQFRRNVAEALEGSLEHCEADWIVFAHQDVYFPAGFGLRLNALLESIKDEDRRTTLIGLAGMAVDPVTHATAPAGMLIDRTNCFDHPASDTAVSLDEFAVIMARDSVHRVDPSLGWHLWATDLCIVSICSHRVFPRIVRLPAFHNSTNDYVLPVIRTLCGDIDATTSS